LYHSSADPKITITVHVQHNLLTITSQNKKYIGMNIHNIELVYE